MKIGKVMLISAALIAAALHSAAQTYELRSVTVANGGGTSAGGRFSLSCTIGEPMAGGDASGGHFAFHAGFWNLVGVVPTPGAPSLRIQRAGDQIVLSWPVSSGAFTLQSTTHIENTNSWADSSATIVQAGDRNTATLPAQVGRLFFRLRSNAP